jgi:GNAT superfamily N-acetyltransferase
MLKRLPAGTREGVVGAMRFIQRSLGEPAHERDASASVTLRGHRAGDMGWIVSRQSALYADEYGWNTEYEALAAEIVAQFLKTFDPAREHCWIAEVDGLPVGAVMIVQQSATVAKLRLLHVEQWARGHGIGRKLIDECVRFARAAGYQRITLWTQANLFAARHLYERAGFTCVAKEAHHRFGHDLVAETWELDL